MAITGAEAQRRWRERHPGEAAARKRLYDAEHREEINARQRSYRLANLDAARKRDADQRERERVRDPHKHRDYARAVRLETLAAYGGRCACCGEDRHEFLALDHIDGGGREERAVPGYSNLKLHLALRRAGWPTGRHRVLCHNCNMAIGISGQCPHEADRRLEAI